MMDEKFILTNSYLNYDNPEKSLLISYIFEQKKYMLLGFRNKTKMNIGRASKIIYKYKSTFSPCEPE